jgi:hypothetical protein
MYVIICNMAKQKPRTNWNDNLSDWKDKAIDAGKVVASRAVVGPLNVVMSNKQVKSVAAETSGVNDVKRFQKDKSLTNAGMVVLSAASYAAPLVKPLYAARAVNSARVARVAPVLPSALTKTMNFGKVSGVPTGVLRGASDLAVSGFRAAETTKSINAVRAGRALAASQKVIQQGKQAESILGAVAATNAARGTARAMERKTKKK